MDGDYFRLQQCINRPHSRLDGEWRFLTGLDDLAGTKYMAEAYRGTYPRKQYRIVEWITGEIYDVVPEASAALDG